MSDKRTCNQCHKNMDMATNDENHYAVCTNPACPNYALLQIAAEQMPKESKPLKKPGEVTFGVFPGQRVVSDEDREKMNAIHERIKQDAQMQAELVKKFMPEMIPNSPTLQKSLPPMFQDVIVYGIVEKLNVCEQYWQARRFTGCTNGFGDNPPWQWLTPCDYPVENVKFWFPIPENRKESR